MASKTDSKTLIFVGLPIVLIVLVVGGYALFGSGDQPVTAPSRTSQTAAAADDGLEQSDSPRREAGRTSSGSSRRRVEGTASATLDDEGEEDEQLPTAKKRNKRNKKRSRRNAQSEDEEEQETKKTGKGLPPARPF